MAGGWLVKGGTDLHALQQALDVEHVSRMTMKYRDGGGPRDLRLTATFPAWAM